MCFLIPHDMALVINNACNRFSYNMQASGGEAEWANPVNSRLSLLIVMYDTVYIIELLLL